MIKIKLFDKNTLDSVLVQYIHTLIASSFKKRWDINRNDVTEDIIKSRLCAVAFKNSEIIGYVGLEDDGEFVNGCCVEGIDINGIYLLASMVKELLKHSRKQGHYLYFAFSPSIDKAIPLTAHFATDGRLSISNETKVINYDSGPITLHRLDFFSENKISKAELLNQLNKLNYESD